MSDKTENKPREWLAIRTFLKETGLPMVIIVDGSADIAPNEEVWVIEKSAYESLQSQLTEAKNRYQQGLLDRKDENRQLGEQRDGFAKQVVELQSQLSAAQAEIEKLSKRGLEWLDKCNEAIGERDALKAEIKILREGLVKAKQAIEGELTYNPMIDKYKLKQWQEYHMKPALKDANEAFAQADAVKEGE